MLVGFLEVADLHGGLRTLQRHHHRDPLAGRQGGALIAQGDGFVVLVIRREGTDARPLGAGEEPEDMPLGAIGGEDQSLHRRIRLVAEAEGRILISEVIEDDRAMILELLVEFIVLGAGGGVIRKPPLPSGRAAALQLGVGEVVFEQRTISGEETGGEENAGEQRLDHDRLGK